MKLSPRLRAVCGHVFVAPSRCAAVRLDAMLRHAIWRKSVGTAATCCELAACQPVSPAGAPAPPQRHLADCRMRRTAAVFLPFLPAYRRHALDFVMCKHNVVDTVSREIAEASIAQL